MNMAFDFTIDFYMIVHEAAGNIAKCVNFTTLFQLEIEPLHVSFALSQTFINVNAILFQRYGYARYCFFQSCKKIASLKKPFESPNT